MLRKKIRSNRIKINKIEISIRIIIVIIIIIIIYNILNNQDYIIKLKIVKKIYNKIKIRTESKESRPNNREDIELNNSIKESKKRIKELNEEKIRLDKEWEKKEKENKLEIKGALGLIIKIIIIWKKIGLNLDPIIKQILKLIVYIIWLKKIPKIIKWLNKKRKSIEPSSDNQSNPTTKNRSRLKEIKNKIIKLWIDKQLLIMDYTVISLKLIIIINIVYLIVIIIWRIYEKLK